MKYLLFFILIYSIHFTCTAEAGDNNNQTQSEISKIKLSEESIGKLIGGMWDICSQRWKISVSENGIISIQSSEPVLGEANGYNFPPGEERYDLIFRFRVVSRLSEMEIAERKVRLKDLRKLGADIHQKQSMGRYEYWPKNKDEFILLAKIRHAERMVKDIPSRKHGEIYLAEEYNMDFFVPNKNDKKAIQYKIDIEQFMALLEQLPEKRPPNPPPHDPPKPDPRL